MSCGENHGVKPPNPEQYLTPLQQKEVTVRHLRTKLKESERRLYKSDTGTKTLSSTFDKMADGLSLGEQVTEEGADSELLVGDSMAEGTDLLDEMVTAATTESGDLEFVHSTPGPQALKALPLVSQEDGIAVVEQAVQTDVVPFSPAISELIQSVLKLQDSCPTSSASPDESGADSMESFSESLSALMVDLTPRSPNSAILLSPVEIPFSKAAMEAGANRLMRELDFIVHTEEWLDGILSLSQGGVVRQYWSSSFLVDLLAVAAPVVPTVLWAFSTQRGGTDPVYNIGTLLRGCCVVALHSLRYTAFHMKT
ncbi:syntabulin-like [Apodemus sylvaticus]|uniref:syntabulin-like n=1 Tax=Apodemus sylvaticus TaxID=10129 RepID=UPI002242A5A5|nr:syntabulin-like [Apodemus sylvaticus]